MGINSQILLNKFANSKNAPYIIMIIISLLAFLVLTVAVLFNIDNISYFDNLIVNNFNSFAMQRPVEPIIFITDFGSVFWVLPVTFLIIVGLIKFKRLKEALYLFIIDGGAGFLTITLKWLVGRSRPVLSSPLTHSDWYGFPSGHATLATCFYGALIYLASIYVKDKVLKILIITFLCLLIILIGISRVYLGAHFPTDVLAGLCIGTFWTALCSLVYKKSKN